MNTAMNTAKLILVTIGAVALAGCATSGGDEKRFGVLTEVDQWQLPAGMVTVVIYEIDGQRVYDGRGAHPVKPGFHTVRVWPKTSGPRSATPIAGAHADALGIYSMPLEINVQAGDRYRIAAVVRRHRTYAGEGEDAEPIGPWRTTVVPVIVSDTEEEKASFAAR